MVFSSLEFLYCAFLPLTLLFYYMIPQRYLRWRNIVLLIASLVFYGLSEPVYVLLMVLTITVDYICGLMIERSGQARKKAKFWLWAGVVSNLAILFFFKYAGFFARNISALLSVFGAKVQLDFAPELPIGISFYTFQALSYVIDVYRQNAEAQHSITSFGTYVTLYPQLVAGPIVRYRDVAEALNARSHTVARFAGGVRRFTAGLAKKVLIANIAGELWESVRLAQAGGRTFVGSWLGILFFTIQIYFDFSGYSDMAIGLGRMIGFEFMENFNYPYISESITDFWRRWHISLSTWFRDYLYIPLGGNRNGRAKQVRNLFIVWFCTGFWHGASWNFMLWGMYYFLLLMLEKFFLARWLDRIPKVLRRIYTMFFVIVGWWLFVAEDFAAELPYLGGMFGVGAVGLISRTDVYFLARCAIFLVIAIVGCTPYPKRIYDKLYEKSGVFRAVSVALIAAAVLLCTAFLVNSSYNPFLYTRF